MIDTPQQLAAPAPDSDEAPDELETADAARDSSDDHLDDLCEKLVWWCRTRRFYGSPMKPASNFAHLGKRSPPRGPQPEIDCSAQLAALYLAVLAQPIESLDRQVFELHYFHRVASIKAAAAALGIGRQHWYTLLRNFRRRAYAASVEIMRANQASASALPTLDK